LPGDAAADGGASGLSQLSAVTERHGLWAIEDKPVGVWERFGVSVGGSENQQQSVARPDGLLTDGDILAGLASDELVRAHQAH
jgi:hypothetical protein